MSNESHGGRVMDMFLVVKADHPDLVGGIVWSECELAWINERITLAILAEREACAMVCETESNVVTINGGDEYNTGRKMGATVCANAIRARNHA